MQITEMRKHRNPEVIRDALYLSNCTSAEAREWLQSRPATESPIRYSIGYHPDTPENCHLLEYILYRRCDKAINLALAEHGRSTTVLTKLYNNSVPTLRALLAGNAWLYQGDYYNSTKMRTDVLARQIIAHGSASELFALCSLPTLRTSFYNKLIQLWDPSREQNQISEERFRQIVSFLAKNPRISQAPGTFPDSTPSDHWLDLFTDYEFYDRAWGLAAIVPITDKWAEALYSLYYRLHRIGNCLKDPNIVLTRWLVPYDGEWDWFRELRSKICELFVEPTLDELRHSDPARRDAFYRTFNPLAFKELDWNEFLAFDDYSWKINLDQNVNVWKSAFGRGKYQELIREASKNDFDMDTKIGYFNQRKEILQNEHPEWFIDEHDDPEDGGTEVEIDHVGCLREEIQELIKSTQAQGSYAITSLILFVIGLLIGVWL